MVRLGRGSAAARRLLVAVLLLTLGTPFLVRASIATACSQPDTWTLASTFDIVANGLAPASYPSLGQNGAPHSIPPSLLKAVGWVESGWRQFQQTDRPLVSFGFGYGIMQITSGMAGADGDPAGTLDPAVQSKIASDPEYNIAYGAAILASKWMATPAAGNRDPSTIEDWYYALWAYNGWGWANNPNNPRFSRQGTPATNPTNFPYQERVLYYVAHPPHDAQGNPLWAPVPVSLPSRTAIGAQPGPLSLSHTHRQPVATLAAVYKPALPSPLHTGASETLSVSIRNTGTTPWLASGPGRVSLGYALLSGNLTPAALDPAAVAGALQGTFTLPGSVPPGRWTRVRVTITAPATSGAYTVLWDMQEGNRTWFSQSGVLPHAVPLTVNGAGTPLPSVPSPTASPPDPPEGLRYVADTAAADGTQVKPRQTFIKGWLVYNNGKTAWTSGWQLKQVSGASMGATTAKVPATRPCRPANVLVSLQAPGAPGKYHSTWRLRDPAGQVVGEPLTVVIVVPPPPTSTPTSIPSMGTPTPTPIAQPGTPTPTPVG